MRRILHCLRSLDTLLRKEEGSYTQSLRMRRILHCLRSQNTRLRKEEGSYTQSLRMRRILHCLRSLNIPLRKEEGSYTQSLKRMRRILHRLLSLHIPRLFLHPILKNEKDLTQPYVSAYPSSFLRGSYTQSLRMRRNLSCLIMSLYIRIS
jgi:hypothetical protein